jgi:hypothetical protein
MSGQDTVWVAGVVILLAVAFGSATGDAQTDLDCGDPGTSPNMPVAGDDEHNLDADDDGIGCENPEDFDTTTATAMPTTAVPPVVGGTAPAAEPVVARPHFTG